MAPVCLLALSLMRMAFPCRALNLVEDEDSTHTIFGEREHTHISRGEEREEREHTHISRGEEREG